MAGELVDSCLDDLLVLSCFAQTLIDYNLFQTGHLHDCGVVELFLKGGDDALLIIFMSVALAII